MSRFSYLHEHGALVFLPKIDGFYHIGKCGRQKKLEGDLYS